jgi:inositol oxygenase
MAPGAIFEEPNVAENFNDHRDGLALEATSDAIDDVNVLKAAMKVKQGTATQEEKDIYAQSEFDSEKDKTQFRQYEDACDRVKNFYREQHEKQTVAYNLRARNHFHGKTRAGMTIWEAMEKLNTLIDESDPPRRQAPLVPARRPDPRPGQAALLLRRPGPVGRCRRHIPGRLRLRQAHHLPRHLQG